MIYFYDQCVNKLIIVIVNYNTLYIQDIVYNKINEEARMLKARIKIKNTNSLMMIDNKL